MTEFVQPLAQSDLSPKFGDRFSFYLRSAALRVLRVFQNLRADLRFGSGNPAPKFRQLNHRATHEFPIEVSESITPLKTSEDPRERALMVGKIENLRQAARLLNGAVLRPGETFSFWRLMGPPWRARGFVTGREIRGGCVIPAIGGGLCQISGALHEAAVAAGLEITERHRHTARLAGVPLPDERDATVFWNYVDLRFRAPENVTLLLEVRLTPEELVVKIRSRRGFVRRIPSATAALISNAENAGVKVLRESCLTCGETACARHVDVPATVTRAKELGALDTHVRTAALLNCVQPEFEAYLSGEAVDHYLIPGRGRRYAWPIPSTAKRRTAWTRALARGIYSRWRARQGRIAAATRLQTSEWIAEAYARMLPYDVEHVIVDLDFLPFLWRAGALGGRTFDVVLTRPPLAVMHERLDRAAVTLPYDKALREFRAPRELVEAESEAFVFAERVITPHDDYARMFPNLRKLEWQRPNVEPPASVHNPRYLLFPESLAAREGAHAAMGAAEVLELPLVVVGRDLEKLSIDSDAVLFTSAEDIPWHEIAAVVHPTLFESWPRLHLHALSLGIPVVATDAVGLEEGDGVTHVPFNDEDALVRALERALRLPSRSVSNRIEEAALALAPAPAPAPALGL